jgi:hypothetical protein
MAESKKNPPVTVYDTSGPLQIRPEIDIRKDLP